VIFNIVDCMTAVTIIHLFIIAFEINLFA